MKKAIKLLTVALTVVIGFSMAACGGDNTNPQINGGTVVTGVTLNTNSLYLTVGGSATLVATVIPINAANKNVAWNSNNTGVATVNNGTVTAFGTGSATITVTTLDGGRTATCTVNVSSGGGDYTSVTGVTLNQTSLNLTVGITATLTATVAPSNATNKNVAWNSDNTNVATVNNGTVTAVGTGSATITVTTLDGGRTATCTVTVVSGGGGNTFTSIEAMRAWLETQPVNTAANPYIVKLNVSSLSEFMNGALSGRYVSLDLSGSTFTNIRNDAFWTGAGGNFTSITIGNSVTSIGSSAFYGNSTLTSVIIGSNVLSIGDGAFEGCSGLTSITIPSKVISIGQGAFSGCSSLTSITIPNGVISIERSTFEGCTILTSVTIPDSVTGIGVYAFKGCTILNSITIPSSVASIDWWAFEGCTNLTSVTFQGANTTIIDNSFPYGGSLQTAYTAGKAGTYRRTGTTWTKQ